MLCSQYLNEMQLICTRKILLKLRSRSQFFLIHKTAYLHQLASSEVLFLSILSMIHLMWHLSDSLQNSSSSSSSSCNISSQSLTPDLLHSLSCFFSRGFHSITIISNLYQTYFKHKSLIFLGFVCFQCFYCFVYTN